MFKRVGMRVVRGILAGFLGVLATKYGADPVWGPVVSGLLLGVDKLLRDRFTVAK